MNRTDEQTQTPPVEGFPRQIGGYDLLLPIGAGSAGTVFWGRHVSSWRAAAVKVARLMDRPRLLQGDALVHNVQGDVSFDHVVRITHLGEEEGWSYCVMELASRIDPGSERNPEQYQPMTLAQRLASGAMPAGEVVALARALLCALEALHAHNVSHGDVKPDNVFWFSKPGVWKLGDFDSARDMAHIDYEIGYPFFKLSDEAPGPQWDLGMCGKTLFTALTGSRDAAAFEAFGAGGRDGRGDQEYEALRRVILRACDPVPQKRFGSAREMRGELERLLGVPPAPPPAPPLAPLPLPRLAESDPARAGRRGSRWLVGGAAAFLVLFVLLACVVGLWPTEPLECSAPQFTEDGQIHLILTNRGRDPIAVSRITLVVVRDHQATRRGPMTPTEYVLPLEGVPEGQSASMPIAFEVKGKGHESLLIAPMTVRVLDVRVELSYDGGRTLTTRPVKLE